MPTKDKPPTDKLSSVRICCIADTHTAEPPGGIPPCDVLVHAGDFSYTGTLKEIQEFNEYMESIPLPTTHKLVIAGNHDIGLQRNAVESRKLLSSCTYLEDASVIRCGLKFYGTPWSADFFPENWAFNQTRGAKSAARWQAIPEDTDVLIVHGPPYGYGDSVRGKHVGCEDLARRLALLRTPLTVCGHIHEDYGIFAAPWGTVVNPSTLSGAYRPLQPAITVTLQVKKAAK